MDWRQNMGVKTEKEHFETYEQKPQKEQKGSTKGAFATSATIALKSQKVKSMNEEEYRFGERAAIMEFDGGLDRENAERQAKRSICVQPATVRKWE